MTVAGWTCRIMTVIMTTVMVRQVACPRSPECQLHPVVATPGESIQYPLTIWSWNITAYLVGASNVVFVSLLLLPYTPFSSYPSVPLSSSFLFNG